MKTPRMVDAHFSYTLPDSTLIQDEATPKDGKTFLIGVSPDCADELGLDLSFIDFKKDDENDKTMKRSDFEKQVEREQFANILSGNELLPGSNPWSYNCMAMEVKEFFVSSIYSRSIINPNMHSLYTGHQFGYWASQLGDGRAITLAEIQSSPTTSHEISLKGAGLTPFSRFADGYAVLRSSIREFLASESLHALGIPTSRCLSLIAIPERKVQREEVEGGAVVSRVVGVGGFIRFGNFELLMKRGQYGKLKELADFTIERGFPQIWVEYKVEGEDDLKSGVYAEWFGEVIGRTARLMAQWQSVGFCHGVMNTDNFSILGLTIDYGPYQFMDNFEAGYICNHSDHEGRYAYNEQPSIGFWNLNRLGTAISPLVVKFDCNGDSKEAMKLLEEKLNKYYDIYKHTYVELMMTKLGLKVASVEDYKEWISPLLVNLESAKWDYTNFFRALSDLSLETNYDAITSLRQSGPSGADKGKNDVNGAVCEIETTKLDLPTHLPTSEEFLDWYVKYLTRSLADCEDEKGKTSFEDLKQFDKERKERLDKINPRYVPRNYILQNVIDEMEEFVKKLDEHHKELTTEDADDERPDFCFKSFVELDNPVMKYLKVLQNPYEDGSEEEQILFGTKFGEGVPMEYRGIKCSCSS
ncbi:hypothetical protein HK098_003030 [Nowakowskiella sp. JEL0407]|nr:hypothetical protein HK098_003030 [Nowakowskiella sp. JEL0407]